MTKQTPLTHLHRAMGARMAPFAGFEMPIEYTGIKDEHFTVREKVGIFDVSHMGALWITGQKAVPFLQKVTSNDISVLVPGKAQYSCFPNGKGGIVDDIIVYKYSNEKFLIVVNASNVEKDFNWICSHNSEGVEIVNKSPETAQIALQGPLATTILKKLCIAPLDDMKPFMFLEASVANCPDIIIATTGYTGAGGYELLIPKESAETIWNALLEVGGIFGLKAIGLGARDTLRLEMGYNLYGNDINDETSPIEAGLAWITKPSNKPDMIDRELIMSQLEHGVTRKLVGFEMIDRGIPRHDYEICDAQANVIGKVTSGSISPMTNAGIGMGYINKPFNGLGSEVYISIRGKLVKAVVVKAPFYKG
jgi:aminomethyltransferase